MARTPADEASDPTTSPARLAAIADAALRPLEEMYAAWGEDPENHLSTFPDEAAIMPPLARHPGTPPDSLARLALFVADDVIVNPALDAVPIDQLTPRACESLLAATHALGAEREQRFFLAMSARDERAVRESLLEHPRITDEVLEQLSHDERAAIRDSAMEKLEGRTLSLALYERLIARDVTWARERIHGLAQDPDAPPMELAVLAASEDPEVRELVAANPGTPEVAIAMLMVDAVDEVRWATDEHPNKPAELAALLDAGESAARGDTDPDADDEDVPFVCTPEQVALLRAGGPYARRLAGMQPTWTPDELAVLARDPDRFVRQGVVENLSCSAALLRALAGDTEPAVRAEVAAKTDDPELLDRLAGDADDEVRCAVAVTPHTGTATLERLAADSYWLVRARVAQNAACPPSLLAHLADDPQTNVRSSVARHPATSAEIVARFAADPDWTIRTDAARNPTAAPTDLERLARDEHRSVRRSVAGNPSASRALIEQLADDPDDGVRSTARHALRR